MLTKRPREERGPTDAGWLKSLHTFSFAGYQDPRHMGFGPLRVINEDRVAPGAGFGTHPHNNMEIVSYVLSGELAHKDSMGNGSTIRPGEVQVMSAGTGVTHSEFNQLKDREVHFLQVWIIPRERDTPPGYQQRRFEDEELANRLRLLVSSDGAEDSLVIRQDARMLAGRFEAGRDESYALLPARRYWLQVARGGGRLSGEAMAAGDGFALQGEHVLRLEFEEQSEILLFDLP